MVWAWIVGHGDVHEILACFHEGTDDCLHLQWRLATTHDDEEDREKSFHHVARPLPETRAQIQEDIQSFAHHIQTVMGTTDVEILVVEGDVTRAVEVLQEHTSSLMKSFGSSLPN